MFRWFLDRDFDCRSLRSISFVSPFLTEPRLSFYTNLLEQNTSEKDLCTESLSTKTRVTGYYTLFYPSLFLRNLFLLYDDPLYPHSQRVECIRGLEL